MADDWQVGNLAMCLKEEAWVNSLEKSDRVAGPRGGQIYRVDWLANDPTGNLFLGFGEWPESVWVATEFRKIRPDTQPSPDGAAFFEMIAGLREEVVQ